MHLDNRPLILHVVYRFDTGGLENGIVNLINHMPSQAYRHAVLALTEVTDFRHRVLRNDVQFISLHKPPGHGIWQYRKLFKIFQELQPDIVHSRNLAALEAQVPAWLAGVPVRIHGEHGRDLGDLSVNHTAYTFVRRVYKPFVHHYIALSRDLENYLVEDVRIASRNVTQAYNGVDASRFYAAPDGTQAIADCPFNPAQHWLVGTVGRMQSIKDQLMLAHAFIHAVTQYPTLRMRLVMVGDGPLRSQVQSALEAAGLADLAWLPGERTDVADIMRGLHAFALPSLSEGISNSILEAMASGLPVAATDVGGKADLVIQGQTGHIVAAADPQGMALRLVQLASNPERARAMGQAGRERATATFSMQAMVRTYQSVYDHQLQHVRPMAQHC